MRKISKESFSPPAVGGTSLLVIFAVLCLTVFSLLSLSTVRADERLSKASAKAVSDYYEADYRAEEILAQIRQGKVPEHVTIRGNRYTYTCPISENQNLEVSIRLNGADYTIEHWRVESSRNEEIDETLPVWDGAEPEDSIENE